jgi:LEA14-like dessication related protein
LFYITANNNQSPLKTSNITKEILLIYCTQYIFIVINYIIIKKMFEIRLKKLKIILIILVLINLIVASFLIINIQIFESPEIIMNVNILDVNSEELILETKIEIINPNSFELIVSDLKVTSKTEEGLEIGNIKINGGNIYSYTNKTFKSTDKLSFKSDEFKVLKNTVNAVIGIKFLGFIQKTIPLKVTVISSLETIFESLKLPIIKINSSFDELSEKGMNFSTSVNIYNPTTFELKIDNLTLDILTDKKVDAGQIKLDRSFIEPNSSKIFISKGTIFYDALDAETLLMKLSGSAGAKIAGINKSVLFSTDASFDIPNIKDFIFYNETIDFGLPIQLKLTLKGISGTIGFRIYNPSNIPLVADNLVCSIHRLDGEKKTLLGQENMDSCQISPKNKICIQTEINVPYYKFFFSGSSRLLPDWIVLRIEGDFSIAGTHQAFPISLEGFVDPRILKNVEYLSEYT